MLSTINSNAVKKWAAHEVLALFERPLNDLLFEAQTVHRKHFNPNEVQLSTLLNIKTGGCPENCSYCPQSAHFDTGVKAEKLLEPEAVLAAAAKAKAAGASRFCMGAAWRSPKERDIEKVSALIRGVKALGLETCATLGMLEPSQAVALKESGLDYYNHNLDTSEQYYEKIITTRSFKDRMDTLSAVRDAGLNMCCGGIMGMGESREDRADFLCTLANMPTPPESVPLNRLVPVAGTPLEGEAQIENFEFLRTIAIARIMMPRSFVRLSAGRETMSDELQAMCFFAGANSIFYGEKLLTTSNPEADKDQLLFAKLGLQPLKFESLPQPELAGCA